MANEFCPKCRSVQPMNISNFEKIAKDKNGKEIKIIIKSYTCSVCHIFVRDEETKKPT